MTRSHHHGRWGEDLARVFLEGCGLTCLEAGYRRPGGEIDLIFRHDQEIVFVEVKTRSHRSVVPAEAWVHRHQLHRIRRLAARWIGEHPGIRCRAYRLDVVAVTIPEPGRGGEIRHLVGVG